MTVHGRVTDIWRSYFTQALLHAFNISVGYYARPLVVHERNFHKNLTDFQAESDLYLITEGLVQFLSTLNLSTAPIMMENLWIDLYERGFVELKDVYLAQHWLQALKDVGYRFPPIGSDTHFAPHWGRTKEHIP